MASLKYTWDVAVAGLGTLLSSLASIITMTTSIASTPQLIDTSLGFKVFFHVLLSEHHKLLLLLKGNCTRRPARVSLMLPVQDTANHIGYTLPVPTIHQSVELPFLCLFLREEWNKYCQKKCSKKSIKHTYFILLHLNTLHGFNINFKNRYWNGIPSSLLITSFHLVFTGTFSELLLVSKLWLLLNMDYLKNCTYIFVSFPLLKY